jgi:putative Ig domain-containing protein/phosphoesterase family protein
MSMRWKVLVAGAALLAGGLAAPLQATAATSANLIVNGNAETGLCSTTGLDTMTIPGWQITSGGPDTVCYGASGYPTDSEGPADAGNGFFAGGSKGNASMQQMVSVSSGSSAINGGGVTYDLAGWLGGYSSQTDDAGVVATFENSAGTSLGTATLAPVTPSERDDQTELLSESATGTVPVNTTQVLVQVSWTYGAGNTTDGYLDDLSLTMSTTITAPVLTQPTSDVPHFDHVFFAYMENENYSASQAPANSGDYIVGNSAAPYLNGTLAPMGSLLGNFYATQHPSDPNYLAGTSGSTWNYDEDVSPGLVDETNLADDLNSAGLTWKGYAQGMDGDCDLTNHNTASGGYYLNDDDVFLDYADNITPASYCDAHNQPLTQMATDLQSASTTPNFVWFVANDYDDMEQGGVSAGDTWLSGTLPEIFSSPAWTTQPSLLILTWDEGYTKSYGPDYSDQVPAYIVASQGMVRPGYVSPDYYDDYSLLATIEDALGLARQTSNDEYAQPLSDVWTGSSGSQNTVTVTNPGSQTSTAGTAASLPISASDSASGQTLSYSATGLPAGLSIGSSTGLISGTPTAAGTSSVTVTATDTTGASGSATFSWTVNPASGAGGPTYDVPIANPGAETGSCSGTGTGNSNVQDWTVTSKPQQVCYGASGFPAAADGPQPPASPGSAFFGGGDDATATMTQTVSVSSQSSYIATGAEPYDVSAWLGGYSSQGDNVGLVAKFLSSSGASLGTATLAPVTPAERDDQTELLPESATGTVPAGTVSITFTLTYTRQAGTFNDGYADDIAMTLGS